MTQLHCQSSEFLVAQTYTQLTRMAAALMRGRTNGHTLQPTAVVNEAYLLLIRNGTQWNNTGHFLGAAARAMRQVLIAESRRVSARKRAGDAIRVPIEEVEVGSAEPVLDRLALKHALLALSHQDQRFARVMELRYIAGWNLEEISTLTGRSLATVKRDWAYARTWLFHYLTSHRHPVTA